MQGEKTLFDPPQIHTVLHMVMYTPCGHVDNYADATGTKAESGYPFVLAIGSPPASPHLPLQGSFSTCVYFSFPFSKHGVIK
jgi:hypothetical protein